MQLRHENLASFIGVSIENSSIYIITQNYARGSLENILKNNEVKLDEMFMSSLIFDILRGMIYLHDSEIVAHGNLRTSNCLIDSRWCCKISDFGLNKFKNEYMNVDG